MGKITVRWSGRRGVIAGAMIAATGATSLTGCGSSGGSTPTMTNTAAQQHAQVVRKSASAMTPAEIDRFERAFSYAVGKGYFDAFSDEHLNHMRNRQHGFELTATAPPQALAGETPAWGYRLLPWHRSFILEGEQMLRAALRERDRTEGRDPREADSLFIPYWDAAHDQGLPAWVVAFQPQGGTALVPEGLPKGNPEYGKPVGSRYDIRFGRWPGADVAYQRLPQPAQVSAILAHDDFLGFYGAIDAQPTIVQSAIPAAQQALETLERRFPGNADVATVASVATAATSGTAVPPTDVDTELKVIDAIMAVGYLATSEAARPHPDQEVIGAVQTMGTAVIAPPHVVLHLWAGGVEPGNPEVRGTVSYFNELAVDPVFWMLHTELDRWWYTWEQTHTGLPPLSGEDAQFQPLTSQEGAWYGGGRAYSLGDLAPTSTLPYRYAAIFTE